MYLTLSSIYTRFNTLKNKTLGKHRGKGEIAQMSNFTFFHYVFKTICILKLYKSHILVVVCSFFEFGMVPKWCIMEWVKIVISLDSIASFFSGRVS